MSESQKKSKKEQFTEYLEKNNLEKVISEMANSVVHALDPHPIVYMIKYLSGLLSDEDRTQYGINISPPFPQGVPIVKYPKFKNENCILSKFLNKDIWGTMKYIKTKYNNNINNLTKISSSDDPIGICLVDGDCIECYEDVLHEVIYDVHKIHNSKKKLYLTNNFALINDDISFTDNFGSNLKKIKFEFSRNIDGFSFNDSNNNNNRVRDDLVKCVTNLINDQVISATKIEDFTDIVDEVSKEEIEWMKKAGFSTDFKNSAVFANDEHSIVIMINFANHFKLIVSGDKIAEMYNKGVSILKHVSLNFQFEIDENFGYVTSDISILGAGLRVSCDVEVPDIGKYEKIIQHNGFITANIDKDTNILHTSQDYRLCEGDEISFLSKYLSKLCGIVTLSKNNEKKNLSFDKLSFKPSDVNKAYAKAYESSYDQLKYVLSSNSNNLNSIISSIKDDKVLLNDKFEYYSFYPFVAEYLRQTQNFDIDEYNHINKPENPREITNISSEEYTSKIASVNISMYRNIHPYSFPTNPENSNEKVEEIITKAIETLNGKGHFANYFSFTDPSAKEAADNLIKENNLVKVNSASKNSGVIQFERENIFGIVNDNDHLSVYFKLHKLEAGASLNNQFVGFIKVMNELTKHINFEYDKKFGFLTSDLNYVGTGMRVSIEITTKLNDDDINYWINGKGFSYKRTENGIVLENINTIGITETEMLCNILFFIKDFIDYDNTKN